MPGGLAICMQRFRPPAYFTVQRDESQGRTLCGKAGTEALCCRRTTWVIVGAGDFLADSAQTWHDWYVGATAYPARSARRS